MLYFKTKKERLIIQISIDVNEFIYMLICPSGDNRVHGYYSFIDEKVWEKIKKTTEPKDLLAEENDADYQLYQEAVEKEDAWQQEMADMDWMLSKAYHL